MSSALSVVKTSPARANPTSPLRLDHGHDHDHDHAHVHGHDHGHDHDKCRSGQRAPDRVGGGGLCPP